MMELFEKWNGWAWSERATITAGDPKPRSKPKPKPRPKDEDEFIKEDEMKL